jgi:hypothetical protein
VQLTAPKEEQAAFIGRHETPPFRGVSRGLENRCAHPWLAGKMECVSLFEAHRVVSDVLFLMRVTDHAFLFTPKDETAIRNLIAELRMKASPSFGTPGRIPRPGTPVEMGKVHFLLTLPHLYPSHFVLPCHIYVCLAEKKTEVEVVCYGHF